MELEDYLRVRGERQASFARRSGVSTSVLTAIIQARRVARARASGEFAALPERRRKQLERVDVDRGCTTTNAYRIVRASLEQPTDTGEWVRWEDLVPLGERAEPLDRVATAVLKRARRRARAAEAEALAAEADAGESDDGPAFGAVGR